ncbi:6-phospho-beta-glucosidase, partial [Escherichia coli]
RLRFSGPKTSIICSPMTSLKTSIKTITYLSDIGCLEIQGASLQNTVVSHFDVVGIQSSITYSPTSRNFIRNGYGTVVDSQ